MSVIALRDDGPPPPAILVGTDFSAGAENAVERSIQIAKATGAPLHILHASSRLPGRLLKVLRDGRDDRAAAREGIARAVEHARAAKVLGHGHHARGAPTRALRAKARELSAALIVVGPGRSRGADTIIGSTAERLAGSVRAPVLLVRSPARRAYRGVIIAADARMDLGAAVEAAAIVAPGRELSVVHACAGPFETTLRLQGTVAHGTFDLLLT